MSRYVRVPKRQRTKANRRGVCTCRSHEGQPKVLFAERWMASRSAGAIMGPNNEMWETYKCRTGGAGWHIATVKWDPWSTSESASPRVET